MFSMCIKSDSIIRFIKFMLLNFYCLVDLLINIKARGNLVK
jgi:hypothetical protein